VVTAMNPRLTIIKKSIKAQMLLAGTAKSLKTNGVWWVDDKLMSRNGTDIVDILAAKDVTIGGVHNKINIAAACAAALCLDIPATSIRKAVKDFKGLPQRLETIASCHGVTFINDSASTNPVTAIAALEAMQSPTIMLVGGRNKGLDFGKLADAIINCKYLSKLIAYGESGPEIAEILDQRNFHQYEMVTGFFTAMQQALAIAAKGDTILLSPAAASFDEFNNSVDRGKKFNQSVHEYCHRKF